MAIIQSIIIHDGISKPKILFDQFCEGLLVLGFKEQMTRHSDVFKPLFVPDKESIHAEDVVRCLTFPASMEEGEANTSDYLKEFLQNASFETLSNFLTFTTGVSFLPNHGLGEIKVKFDSVDSIFASACVNTITLPTGFSRSDAFTLTMNSVLDTVTIAFTNV